MPQAVYHKACNDLKHSKFAQRLIFPANKALPHIVFFPNLGPHCTSNIPCCRAWHLHKRGCYCNIGLKSNAHKAVASPQSSSGPDEASFLEKK